MNTELVISTERGFGAALELLAASGDPTKRLLQRAGVRRGWWKEGRYWQRTWARFDPDTDPWCTLLYETVDGPQRLGIVEVCETRPAMEGPEQLTLAHETLGWLRISRFPCDPCLVTLPEVLASVDAARVVRYRPRRRCTLVFVGHPEHRASFGKVFADDRGERLHAESHALWEAAQAGILGFAVAHPGRWYAPLRLLTQGRVDGAPVVAELHGKGGAALAARMGAACASLAVSSLRPTEIFGGAAQLARSSRYAAELRRRAPPLAGEIDATMGRLAELHRAAGARAPRPIHGAPHAHQWLAGAQGLGLVDFDRHCLGDPELDVATFVAETDFEDREHVPVAALNDAFIDAYERVAGPLDRYLLRAYRAHKRLAKALKAARNPHPHAAAKAARNLRSAARCAREAA